MKIRTQFIVTMVVFGLVLVIVAISILFTNQRVEWLTQQYQIAQNIERDARELGYLSNDYLLYRESQQSDRWIAKFNAFSDDIAHLNPDRPEQQVQLNNIKASQARLRAVFANVVETVKSAPPAPGTAAEMTFVQVSWSRMEVQNQGMVFDAQILSQQFDNAIDQARLANDWLILLLVGLIGVYFIANYSLVYRRILRAVSELQTGTEIIGSGNLDFSIREQTKDEIGDLARAFNRMAANLKQVTASQADLEREIAERKKAEQAVAHSNAKLTQVLDSIQDDFYVLDRDWKFVYTSRSFTLRVGKEPKDFVGNCIWEMFPKHLGTNFEENLRAAMDKSEIRRFEIGGKYTNAVYSMTCFPSAEGITVLGTDITARKRAEEQLRTSEERFKAIASSTPDHLLVQDRDLRYTMVLNPQLGLTEQDMVGKTDYDILSKEDADPLIRVKRQVLETAQSIHVEVPATTPTGEREYFDGTYVPKFDAQGEVDGLIGYFRNITERKKREEELARLNRTLRAHSHSDQALMRATNETEYIQEVCRIIVEDCGHAMVWVGFAEDDTAKTVRPVAYAGFEQGYLETLHLTWADTERGRGPTGTAIRTGQPSFCRNMTTDPRFAPWRAEALRRGYASSLVLPLLDAERGRALGALTIYFREPDPFTKDEVTLLTGLADDLTFGIRTLRLRAARARVEAQLRASEEHYRSLFEGINEGFALHEMIFDAAGQPIDYRFLEINPAFERLTGLNRADVIGKTVQTVMPDTEEDWIQRYGQVVLTGEPTHFENYSGALDQHYEVFAYRPAPGQFAVLFLNVTERKRAEERAQQLLHELELQTEELQQANIRLEEALAEEQVAREEAEAGRNILESLMRYAPEVIMIADAPSANIRLISHYAEKVTGRSLSELVGVPARDHPAEQDLFQPDGITPMLFQDLPLVRAIQRGETVLDQEMVLHRLDGTHRTILANAGPIRDSQGHITGGIAAWRDITARKDFELQVQKLNRNLERRAVELEIANKELESFSYSVSHDLRTPLAAINGFANILLQDCVDQMTPEALRYLELIRDNSQEMNQLVEGLLAFSRFIRQPLHKQTVNLNQLARQVAGDLRAQQPTRRIEIAIAELGTCQADPVLLKQVLVNLLSNAIKFTRKREVARIEIQVSQTDDGERLYSIQDNGVGFDPEQAEKLFGVFQRLHSQEDYEGTGVGLAIVERIIKRHGGRVCADGELDKGATFYFTIPD